MTPTEKDQKSADAPTVAVDCVEVQAARPERRAGLVRLLQRIPEDDRPGCSTS